MHTISVAARISTFAIALLLFASCKSTLTSPTPSTPVDANGGTWKTIVLSSGYEIPLSAPPADGYASTIADLNEIKAAQGSLTVGDRAAIQYWDTNVVVRWNQIARSLVMKYKTNPPMASRFYALLSVGQYDAAVSASYWKYKFNRIAPSTLDHSIIPSGPIAVSGTYPSDHAAIDAVSCWILKSAYPSEAAYLDSLRVVAEESRIKGGYNYRSDVSAGDFLGKTISDAVGLKAEADNSDMKWTDTIPVGPQYWRSSQVPAAPPLLPLWGKVRMWIADGTAVAPLPTPVFGSQEYLTGLQEVRQISDTRTAAQTSSALFWADGAGTATPPGHWNQIASDAIIANNMSLLRSARTLALLNMAMEDAGVCCWDCKYKYWLIRPSQADTNIHLVVPLPNFPSYISGHSSFSGAASRVLDYLFPASSSQFDAQALDASLSRLYGGIHYRFDCERGITMGNKIGDEVVAYAKADGSQ